MTVLAGRAAEFESEIPFGLFVDALDDAVLGLSERDLGALGPQAARELATVFPSLGGRLGARTGGAQIERYRAHRAVRALLEGLAARTPLVLALDDVHWADPASAELLSYLLSRPPRGPALVVVAFRPGQVGSRLAQALSSAVREGTGERIDLGPLTVTESAALLGSASRDVEPLYRDCGGNPFFLQQLAKARGFASVRSLVPLEDLEVPAAVRAALSEELSQLSPPARSMVEAASVVGIRSSPTWRQRWPAWTGPRAWRPWTSCWPETWCGWWSRPASGSDTPSCGAPCTTPPAEAGGSAPTAGRRWLWTSGAPR
jgi:predicted ATPase